MKISDYMPDLYNKNIDMTNIIYSEEDELENGLKKDIENSFHNTFIKLANETGIQQYEDMLGIKGDPTTEDIEFRRQRVLSRLISQIPFTERYMINSINEILGVGNWEYEINYSDYSLLINSTIPGHGWLNELYEFLKRTIPCNIDYTVVIYAATWQLIMDNFTTWQDIYDRNMTWQELMDAEWL